MHGRTRDTATPALVPSAIFLLATLWFATPAFACSCVSIGSSACSSLRGSAPVFVALVLKVGGEGRGIGPARVRIEEGLVNTPEPLGEVDLDTGAGSGLKAGERYVIYASNRQGKAGWSISCCSLIFPVRGNEHRLDALRNAVRHGPSRLVGNVLRMRDKYSTAEGIAGAVVTAKSSQGQYSTVTGDSGKFEIFDLRPGYYRLEVSKAGFEPADEFNLRPRPTSRFLFNEITGKHEADPEDKPGTVHISAQSCTDEDLALWPDRSISGRIFDTEGGPLPGVTVQVFTFQERGRPSPSPERTAISNANGEYALRPLPDGKYLVGVNIAPYADSDAYPPTQASTRLRIFEALPVKNINLTLPPKRIATTLHLQVIGPDGAPFPGASVKLTNPAGRTRITSIERTPASGSLRVPVYLGEQYIVHSYSFPKNQRDFDYLGGQRPVMITTRDQKLRVVMRPERFQRDP